MALSVKQKLPVMKMDRIALAQESELQCIVWVREERIVKHHHMARLLMVTLPYRTPFRQSINL